ADSGSRTDDHAGRTGNLGNRTERSFGHDGGTPFPASPRSRQQWQTAGNALDSQSAGMADRGFERRTGFARTIRQQRRTGRRLGSHFLATVLVAPLLG